MAFTHFNLPLLEKLELNFDLIRRRPFAGFACIFVQHLLGSNVSLIKTIEKAGVARENLWIVGKAYSSNEDVLEYLQHNNYNVYNPLLGYNINTPYDDILVVEIRKILRLALTTNMPILILDDAAKAISIAHEAEFIESINRIKCVELTTRGVNMLLNLELKCPIINVAMSFAKKVIEAQLIGISMAQEFKKILNTLSRFDIIPINQNILLIGYGAIGKNVAIELKKQGYGVIVFDTQQESLANAVKDGFYTVPNIALASSCGIVVGCTGTININMNHFTKFSSGSFFVNMASSDLEFGLWKFEGKKHVIHANTTNKNAMPWKCLYKIENRTNYFYLINGGFPINFTGEVDPISPKYIQLTRALMLIGAIQVTDEKKNGLIDLNKKRQDDIINDFLTENNKYALD